LGLCPIEHGNIARFLNSYRNVISNKGFNVQAFVDSNTCGVHCIYVASKLCAGKSLEDVMQSYRQGIDDASVRYNECLALTSVMKRFVKLYRFDNIVGC